MDDDDGERRSWRRRSGDNLHERVTVMETTMMIHLRECERRGLRIERLGWAIGTGVLATLGFLLKLHFFPG